MQVSERVDRQVGWSASTIGSMHGLASGHDRRGERRRGDQRRGALQARMLAGGDRPDLGFGGGRRQRALGQRRAHGAFDEIPGQRDLAADVDAGRDRAR